MRSGPGVPFAVAGVLWSSTSTPVPHRPSDPVPEDNVQYGGEMVVFASRQARTRRRLSALSARIEQDRQRLGVIQEQVRFLTQVEADARTDAVVAEDLGMAREHTAAERDLQRAVRDRDEVQAALAARRAEQDRLLEELLDPGGAR